MGHLMTTPCPHNIHDFVIEKMKNKLVYTTDNNNLGCRFYILKSGLLNKWTYNINGDAITIDYSGLDKFNINTMRLL